MSRAYRRPGEKVCGLTTAASMKIRTGWGVVRVDPRLPVPILAKLQAPQ
ncbi:MAG: hypothetical protein ACK6CU_28205 [Deltaproteobacteria bacterium]